MCIMQTQDPQIQNPMFFNIIKHRVNDTRIKLVIKTNTI